MQSTKSQILAALKRQGHCSVDELAVQLSLAPMTVRQHLAMLERDSLVESHEERQRLGRPHFVFVLTEKGEASFPKRYDEIARQLLREVGRLNGDEIAGLSPAEKTGLLFDRLADRFVDRHREALDELSLAKRVAAVAHLLEAESGFAEWARTEGGFVIRDYNCCYRRLNGDDEPCRWHARVLVGLLGCSVDHDPDATPAPHTCRFVVPETQTAGLIAQAVPREASAARTEADTASLAAG